MISLLKILFEQEETTASSPSSSDSSINPKIVELQKKIGEIDKATKETAKNVLLIQKTQGQKPQTPTKSDATTGTTELDKPIPTKAAGTQAPVGTNKEKQQTDVVTSKDLVKSLDTMKKELLGAFTQKKEN